MFPKTGRSLQSVDLLSGTLQESLSHKRYPWLRWTPFRAQLEQGSARRHCVFLRLSLDLDVMLQFATLNIIGQVYPGVILSPNDQQQAHQPETLSKAHSR